MIGILNLSLIIIWTENKTSSGDYIALWFGSTVGHMNACGQEAFYINLCMSHGFALDVAGSYFGRHTMLWEVSNS